jgi:localization factor PodJL
MRAELPWNVAGIPPEAREAARAAARREGLSVGEWLTRRILRSFSGMEEELPSLSGYESRAPTGAPLDAWGLPPSAAARRDTEEMMARVGRSEAESGDAWRRIEEQLRGLSRRMDSSERSHSENNRVISRTAQEINISAREQAQVFDQLGLNVMSLNERMERVERNAANDGVKEAVKALHTGLSRLADQITTTNNNSAQQVTQLAGNLEQLAGRVGQARVDAEDNHRALEERLNNAATSLEQRLMNSTATLDQKLANATTSLEQRLAAAEKTAQFNTNALDHALEKLEASANQRATDQVDQQRRAALTEESIHRLEDAIARLEMRLPDGQMETRLDGIERSVSGMAERLENYDPSEKFDSTMQALSHRLEALEKDHGDLVVAMRALRERPSYEPPPAFETRAYQAPAYSPEPPPVEQAYAEPFSSYAAPETYAAPPTPGGFHFDIPPETDAFAPASEFGPELQDMFVAPDAEPENFLSQARRNARAASEKAQSEQRSRFNFFNREQAAAATTEKQRPRFVIPVAIALIAALAVAAGLVLMNRAKAPGNTDFPAKPAAQGGPTYTVPAPPDGDDTQFVVAPQANDGGDPNNTSSMRSEPGAGEQSNPPRTAMPLQNRPVRNAPVNPVPEGKAAPSNDRVVQLANNGNPIALTILGLKALDGNGQPVNLPDAVKYLTQAAQKGQAVAQYRLGTLYERGQGVTADGAQAAHWYEMAANQGNRKAMHNLAVAYASGGAGKKNMAEAARWFAKAAGLGLSDSQFNLAVLYERGDGVPQSLLDAYKWYSIAAAQGDGESKSRLSMLQSQLSDSDKAAANKSAATFHAAPLNRSANVPPEAADLAGQ